MPKAGPSKESIVAAPEIRDSQGSSGQYLELPNQNKKVADPSTTDEKVFGDELTTLAQSLGLEVDFNAKICGRVIPLFRLWQVVRSDEFGGFDEVDGRNLWGKVASRLDFHEFRHANAASELKQCYEEVLVDFENMKDEYEEDQSLTESQEKALIESQLRNTSGRETHVVEDDEEEIGEEDEHDGDLDRPPLSSPRVILTSSSKRSFGADHTNQSYPYNKRQRIDKGKGREWDISSTPDEVVNAQHAARTSYMTQSQISSPHSESEEVVPGSEVEAVKRFNFQRPERQASSARVLDPETQEFHVPPESHRQEDAWLEKSSPLPEVKDLAPSNTSNAATRGSVNPAVRYDSSTQSQTDSQREREAVFRKFIDFQVSEGYPEDIVIEALEATTMETKVARKILDALLGEGIPDNMRGVWTWRDDDALYKPAESEEYKRVVKKHGLETVEVRKRFLRDRSEMEVEGVGDRAVRELQEGRGRSMEHIVAREAAADELEEADGEEDAEDDGVTDDTDVNGNEGYIFGQLDIEGDDREN